MRPILSSSLILPALLAASLCRAEEGEQADKVEQAQQAQQTQQVEPSRQEESTLRYVVGGRLHWQPEYAGSTRYGAGLTPIWAIQWGRWHISASGGTALLGFGSEVRGDGAAADLVNGDKWRFGVALRIDSGRNSS